MKKFGLHITSLEEFPHNTEFGEYRFASRLLIASSLPAACTSDLNPILDLFLIAGRNWNAGECVELILRSGTGTFLPLE